MRSQPVTIVLTRAPFGSERARSGLDMALAFAAFEQPVSLVFREDALSWLTQGHDGTALLQKDYTRIIDELALYDIDKIFVLGSELQARQMAVDKLRCPVQALTQTELNSTLAASAKVWIF